MNEKARLEYLRQQIEAESISYGEIAELQGLAGHIDPSDVVLLEWAGVCPSEHVWIPGCGVEECDTCWPVCDVCNINKPEH